MICKKLNQGEDTIISDKLNWKIISIALILAIATIMSFDYAIHIFDKYSLGYIMFMYGIFWIEIIVPFVIKLF